MSNQTWTLKKIIQLVFAFALISSVTQTQAADHCAAIFNRIEKSLGKDARALKAVKPAQRLSEGELINHTKLKITKVHEFDFIRNEAERRGLRVWLFGGTASSFLHYVKWDLARSKGLMDLQADRFDFDFTNIFRSTQDLDIVADTTPEKAREFQNAIAAKFPHFLGSKAAMWEVRTLRSRMGTPGTPGFKEALLNDADFNNQNTDSNSLGMVEITKSNEPVIRDLKHWNGRRSQFLDDTLNNRISYFRSKDHFTTSRAKLGQNPEILSVVRLLVKAFQYDLNFSRADFDTMKSIVDDFDPRAMTNVDAVRRLQDTSKKLVMHAVNIEYAMDMLDELGLRKKLVSMGNSREMNSSPWWLSKEPLRSKAIGEGQGKTAQELNVSVVAHETNSFLAYESITRSHSGEPNVFISRQNAVGETAAYGNGFYTRSGKVGARGTGLTIRFEVDPEAREGTDFIRSGDYLAFRNKKALKVIQESLNFGLDDLMKFAGSAENFEVDPSDLALLEKLKRRLNASRIMDELEMLFNSPNQNDQNRLLEIFSNFPASSVSKLISAETLQSVAKNIYNRISTLENSKNEQDIIRFITTVGPILRALESAGALTTAHFHDYLNKIIYSDSSLEVKKVAVFEKMLTTKNAQDTDLSLMIPKGDELAHLPKEMRNWNESNDPRKRNFAASLSQKWSEAISQGKVDRLQSLIKSQIFDINQKSISGQSALMLADYYQQKTVIDWLIENPNFDVNMKNSHGFTEIEQLRLLGKNELADRVEKFRPESKARKFRVRERNDDGSPIEAFVRIQPGSFLMGEGSKVLTTLTKPFEIMSTQTTQKTWREVTDLIKKQLPGKYDDLNRAPSSFRGDTNPVEQVSYNDIVKWLTGLNELSKSEDGYVQERLKALLPRHKKGDEYRLPSEAEREFVQRNQGLAEGNYSFGNSKKGIDEYAWYRANSRNTTHPVGRKKPLMISGRPIYDIQGNVFEWVSDWYGQKPQGGVDPQGPNSGSFRVLRGAAWSYYAQDLGSARRGGGVPGEHYSYVGFRLVRTAK